MEKKEPLNLLLERQKLGIHVKSIRDSIVNIDESKIGITQQLMEVLVDGLSRRTIGEVENAKTNARVDSLNKIAAAFNISLYELCDYNFMMCAIYRNNKIEVVSSSTNYSIEGEKLYKEWYEKINDLESENN
ncbi:helix-turn-helix transcriptional regulator [Chryseobacterium gotjawalense]|uniref:Helix-turn-helix transcriptional regulator n=1 Tax=Chryseobacterium gotjawalense TaxID=3042315 RepID=A0ABY8RCP6_9FLAO|nr:helix-turn-helix transcriptional regulator [Chryseobacterium sp. wdc7]WHF51469.1 helix-turn-helix transcriptional regulator [Chryseobacterium sp. wdc7]